jgi:hypothetical protein
MRFSTWQFGGEGQIFNCLYRQIAGFPGGRFAAHILQRMPSIFDRCNWAEVDRKSAFAAYEEYRQRNQYGPAIVATVFESPDAIVVLTTDKDCDRQALAEAIGRLVGAELGNPAEAIGRLIVQSSAPRPRNPKWELQRAEVIEQLGPDEQPKQEGLPIDVVEAFLNDPR